MTQALSKVNGFLFSGISCGIKKNGGKDLGIIFSLEPAVAAGMFTKNKVKAAPVNLDIKNIKSLYTRAVVVNSGNANACGGEQGEKDAFQMTSLTASQLGIKRNEILVASTGVIGQMLPMDKVALGIEKACKNLAPSGINDFTKAIMTTDSFPKKSIKEIVLDSVKVTVLGVAKGAGMICPDMATLLCFIVTDANIDKLLLTRSLKEAVDESFNLITVDTDTSTNDSVIAIANGLAGNKKITRINKNYNKFTQVLKEVLKDLALKIVRDGEGATKLITIHVKNAKTKAVSKKVAMTIAKSTLVKTAFFGEDANWGRIICAIGYSGVKIDPFNIDIFLDKAKVFSKGKGVENLSEIMLKKIMKKKEITIVIDLKQGKFSGEVYTCDLSYNYVKINASYRS
ncbi:MAG: bifunctional glutamate N-acetyltransferase/amino-acid acetyltransferase ArgJ [Candidatus Firestonebacteria bacterium]|nr:bifunctional glutamate N-acetyltransferase/amino-acid acetyltransferase ArgJ [Candidatus Firestonebacteria bacterium]